MTDSHDNKRSRQSLLARLAARLALLTLLIVLGLPTAQAVDPEFGRICSTSSVQGEGQIIEGSPPPGVGQLLPGRYYSPKRSGQGWDFFWYGNPLEDSANPAPGAPPGPGSTPANDKLFVTFYTYEWDASKGRWVPAWYGATYDPLSASGAQLGFTYETINGVPTRMSWTGKLHRYNSVSFSGGYGPIRQAIAGSTPPADLIGSITVYFGADGISAGQRPNYAAAKWKLNASPALHPGAPSANNEDCLVNAVTVNETQPSTNAGYVGVWADENSAAGWFWTPVFWNFEGVEHEHHLLAFFDAQGAPSWIVAGAHARACFSNDPPIPPAGPLPYPPAEPNPENIAQCAMRTTGYAPWQQICTAGQTSGCSNWNSADYQVRVGKLIRGPWEFSEHAGVNRTRLSMVIEPGLQPPGNAVPNDLSPLSVSTGPFETEATVSQLAGFTRLRVDDATVTDDANTCAVAAMQYGPRAPGLCELRVHYMTEGAHPNLTIVRRRVVGPSGPDDIHIVSTGEMRSPRDGRPFPATPTAPGNAESLIIGDQFYFQAFVDNATAMQVPTPNPLFSTRVFLAKRRQAACSAGDELTKTPTLTVLPADASGQRFQISAAQESGLRIVYGVRLRVYQTDTGRLFSERLVTLNLSGAPLNQIISVPGFVAGQKYSAKAEVFNHCTVKPTSTVALNPPVVTLLQPASNTSMLAGTAITLSASVTDDGVVNTGSIRFLITKSGSAAVELAPTSSNGSNHSLSWTPAVGVHSIRVRASDTLGLVGITAMPARTVTATPSIVISASPSTGLVAPASTTLSAVVTPNAGVTSVVFQHTSGAAICTGTLSGSSYSCAWNGIAAGSYSVRARTTIDGQAYDSAAMSLSVVPGSSNSVTRRYVYDANQRLCKTIEPESGATILAYDAAGRLDWSVEGSALTSTACDRDSVPAQDRVKRTYDAMGRVLQVDYPGRTDDINNTYEADGALSTTATAGNIWTYTYNRRRLLENEQLQVPTPPGGALELPGYRYVAYAIDYTYNGNGHLDWMRYPDGATLSYAPNALGQPTEVGNYANGISYYPNGAIHSFTYGNGVVHTMTPNLRQLPAQSRSVKDDVAILDDRYDYDGNGNVTFITDQAETGITTRGMSYDGLNRLVVAVAPDLWGTATYSYDALDNLKTAYQGEARKYHYVYNSQNRLTQINNHLGVSQFALGYNSAGDIVSKNASNYSFDAAHRLLSVSGIANYVYDAHGRRVSEIKNPDKPEQVTEYGVYNMAGQKLFREHFEKFTRTRYIYLAGTQIAATDRVGGIDVVTRYLHTDALGSVVAESDNKGEITQRHRYSPYGESLSNASGTLMDGLGYTGHEMDADTGLTYMQQRYQDPVIGRFLSVDPVAANAGSFNRYWYANGNPYRFTDPDGRNAISPLDWYDFASDVGGLIVTEMVYVALVVAGEDVAASMALADMSAGVADAAASTAGLVSPVPGTGRALKAGKAVAKASDKAGDAAGVSKVRRSKSFKNDVWAANTAKNSGANKCDSCGVNVKPGKKLAKGDKIPSDRGDADHKDRLASGGADDAKTNGQLLCHPCHVDKTRLENKK